MDPGYFKEYSEKEVGLSAGDQYRDLRDDSLNMPRFSSSHLTHLFNAFYQETPVTDVDPYQAEQQAVERVRSSRQRIDAELSKVIIGQRKSSSSC
ncbi:MAG: hypothetical protein R3C99_17540 [Pirellulaceae bacterium]